MKKGSALLIVLGLMVFLVASAIGFLTYMRESRVPSSHLRREAMSRTLLKSALANAIRQIEAAVDDEIYPGITPANQEVWPHRVLTPKDPGAVEPSATISSLSFEALAYLPPAIINEVRIQSRRTPTAMWQKLAYDLGRYVFCAVNVSDCFDLNKVKANVRRTSSPDSRITFDALFPRTAVQLENILSQVRGPSEVPFVSVADFNVVAGTGSRFAPFMRYVSTGGSSQQLYSRYEQADVDCVSNALFITDTWFPTTNNYLGADLELKEKTRSRVYDLMGENGQPFKTFGAASITDIFESKLTSGGSAWAHPNLGVIGLVCLYDYLDQDSIPTSFALPCMETAPMVCGLGVVCGDPLTMKIGPNSGGGRIEAVYAPTDASGKKGEEETIIAEQYSFQMPRTEFAISAAVTFPFKRTQLKELASGGYSVKAVAKLFFAPAGIASRTGANADNASAVSYSPVVPRDENGWKSGVDAQTGVISVAMDMTKEDGDEKTKDNPSEEETVCTYVAQFDFPALNVPLFWKVDRKKNDKVYASYYSRDGLAGAAVERFPALTGQLQQDAWNREMDKNADPEPPTAERIASGKIPVVAKEIDTKNGTATDLAEAELVPHIAVFVRIEKDGETVDVVPAGPNEDAIFIQRDNSEVFFDGFSFFTRQLSQPILDFRTTEDFKFKIGLSAQDLGKDAATSPWQWPEMYAVDPRYNYAAEDWFVDPNPADTAGKATARKWLDHVHKFLGKEGRDRDIFMFTSDQEYLQSVGELQFLPFTQELDGRAKDRRGTFLESVRYDGADLATRTGTSSFSSGSHEFFWRTYSGYDKGGSKLDDPYRLLDDQQQSIEVVSGRNGFKLNPLSADSRVMTAAVVETPYDYFIASTNENLNAFATKTGQEAKKYAFGENGLCDQWEDDQSLAIAQEMQQMFREEAKGGARDWHTLMRKFDWDDGGEGECDLFGVTLDNPLHGVDRKFLFSFWHECFQNQQQLYLIFLRAEPLTVGGVSGDALANAQLGARGVALVWRDPLPPLDRNGQRIANAPHRVRVLFYHQFE